MPAQHPLHPSSAYRRHLGPAGMMHHGKPHHGVQVWPVRPGELTATVLDSPMEEEPSGPGWTSTIITTEEDPGGGGASEVQVSGEGPAVMQELVSQLEGLVEGGLLPCVCDSGQGPRPAGR